MRSAISVEFVEVLADHQHRGAALGEIDQRLADGRRRAGIDAPGRLADHQNRRLAQNFAADDEFLQIAAGQADGFGIALGFAHVEGLGGAVDGRERRQPVDEAALAPCRWRRGRSAARFPRVSCAARCRGRAAPPARRPRPAAGACVIDRCRRLRRR